VFLLVEIRIAIQGVDSLISCAYVLPSRLILFDLTFSVGSHTCGSWMHLLLMILYVGLTSYCVFSLRYVLSHS
jgi:hypothetical protein